MAIVAMVVFHLAWDLYYFGFSNLDVTTDPAWVVFQRVIASAFLLLVGVGLVLGHGAGIRWQSFWRRFAIILGAALLTTIGTYIALPEYFVYFGILHAIAFFSLLGLAFLRLPWWGVLLAALVFLVPPLVITPQAVMMERWWSWIGFWPLPPPTTDVVPVFPWFGVVLLGIGGTKLLLNAPLWTAIAGMKLGGPIGRTLRWMGRWSLVIYLVHQPLLYGALQLVPRPAPPDTLGFTRSCEAQCTAGGGEAGFCARYCLCALEQVETENLWSAIENPDHTAAEELAIGAVTRLCEAMAKEGG